MSRELQDDGGIAWSCIQAFAGLGNDPDEAEAARVDGDRVQVVCTPSGGAKSVRLRLPQHWEEHTPDESLLAAIQEALAQGEP